MGKKSSGSTEKVNKKAGGNYHATQHTTPKKLSPLKRNELNQLTDKILKVSSSVSVVSPTAKEWEAYEELQKLLAKVKVIEKDLDIPLPPRSAAVPGFTSWLQKNGALMDGVGIMEFPGVEFGICAERDFSEGDLMIAVPRSLMLTVEDIQNTPLGTLAKTDPLLQHMPNVALALLLLVERLNPKSFWQPYITMLPHWYSTVLNFSSEEMLQLKGSPAFDMSLKQCRNIARQYAYFSRLFQNGNDPASELLRDVFTYELYGWAVSTVMTRQNIVVSTADPNSTVQALIPLWDMCNHMDGKLSTDYNVELARSECLAWRPFSKGSQIYIFYGVRNNCDMLVHNGFVNPGSVHDSVRIRLGVASADPLHAEKVALLQKLGLPSSGDWELSAGPRPITPRLTAFLRIFCMDKDQLAHWFDGTRAGDLLEEGCALEAALQAKMWAFLVTRIKLLMAAYPTKREEDERVLAEDSTLTQCKRLAVQLRLEEKRILDAALGYAEQRTHA